MGKILKGDGKAIMAVFIGAIIAIALLTTIAVSTTASTTEGTAVNVSYTGAAEGVALDLVGRSLIGTGAAINATSEVVITGNVTIANGISATTGLQVVQLTLTAGSTPSYVGEPVAVSYTYQPEGFLTGANGTIILLVVLFAALGILIFTIVVFIKNGSLGKLMEEY